MNSFGYSHHNKRIVRIWLQNGDMLLVFRRSNKRETYPLMWDILEGATCGEENDKSAVSRIIKEALGQDIGSNCIKKISSEKLVYCNYCVDTFIVQLVDHTDNLKLKTDLYCDMKWVQKSAICEMIAEGSFIDMYDCTYLDSFLN